MFGLLAHKFRELSQRMRKERILTEQEISNFVREVRLTLLASDAGFSVVSTFIKEIKGKIAQGNFVHKVHSGEELMRLLHKELVILMGERESKIALDRSTIYILLFGMQGSGKTTQAAKLARFFSKYHNRKPLLVALDLQRPAAVRQLQILGESIDVDVFVPNAGENVFSLAKRALLQTQYDFIIFDTAGRSHVDEVLMEELSSIKRIIDPQESLFVANSALGQDAVRAACDFDHWIGITGSILTMLDGSTKAGAALSIRYVTGKPIFFEGVGEKIEDLQIFHPNSMADRILGMGDMINFMQQAKVLSDDEEDQPNFTFEGYLQQMGKMQKMGSFRKLLKMMPGFDTASFDDSEEKIVKHKAIILSMTKEERCNRVEFVPNRKRRIAAGSGTTVEEVSQLIKNFKKIEKLAKSFPKMKKESAKKGLVSFVKESSLIFKK